MVLAFALLLAAVRLAVIGWSAPLVPFWDEWTATADLILKPYCKGQVPWEAIWEPHNGHRIVLTRLWEIGWFSVLGQWDPTVVASLNSILLTAAEFGFVCWIALAWPARAQVLWLIGSTAILAVPYGYENLLVAFQSQFHFLIVLGLIAICAATRVEDSPLALPVAVLSAGSALFTVAAGIFVTMTIGLLAALQTIACRAVHRRTAMLFACSVAIFGLGWAVRAPSTFVAAPPAQIILAVVRYAGWPASNLANLVVDWPQSSRYLPASLNSFPSQEKPVVATAANLMKRHHALIDTVFGTIALITYLPGAILLTRLLNAGGPAPRPELWALIGVAGWSVLNVVGMAVARGGDLLVPPRYQDLLVLGLLANAGALIALVPFPSATSACFKIRSRARGLILMQGTATTNDAIKPETGQSPTRAGAALSESSLVARRGPRPRWLIPLWLVPIGTTLAVSALGVLGVQLPRKARESARARETVQAYVASGNPEIFRNRPPNFVPWPGGQDELAKLLLDPEIRAVLPVELRAPPERPSIPGRIVRRILRIAPIAAAFGALLFCVLAYLVWKSSSAGPGSRPGHQGRS